MTLHLAERNQYQEGYVEVSPDQLVGKTGEVAITLSAGTCGAQCSVNIRNEDERGSTQQVYTRIHDIGEAKVAAITVTLQPTTPADAKPIKLHITRNPKNQWDVKREQAEVSSELPNQSATSIPYGRCHVVALDIQRTATRETPTYRDTTDMDPVNGSRSGLRNWLGRLEEAVAAATFKNIC